MTRIIDVRIDETKLTGNQPCDLEYASLGGEWGLVEKDHTMRTLTLTHNADRDGLIDLLDGDDSVIAYSERDFDGGQ